MKPTLSVKTYTRRDFLRQGAHAAAAAGLWSSFGAMSQSLAAGGNASGYKALVCLFLFGGNNAFNWIVPTSDAGYASYSRSRSNLALARSSLLPLKGVASDGGSYGLHPSCPELQTLFNQDHAAILCNVGSLVAPTTAAQAQGGGVTLPLQLFSHVDQQAQWMTGIADSMENHGWAGRLADLNRARGQIPNLSTNLNVGGGLNYWQDGRQTLPYVVGTNLPATVRSIADGGYRGGLRQRTARELLRLAEVHPSLLVKEVAASENTLLSRFDSVADILGRTGDPQTPFPAYDGDTGLGAQLLQVARYIKAQSQIGDARQTFFLQLEGFDTHNNELSTQQNLLRILSRNMSAFWDVLGELGMRDQVTLFTNSDFGRSLGSNGDGSDHAWGGHAMVMGGAVRGGRYFGRMPSLDIGGADDFGAGRIVPTTSVQQYSATLARWFGVLPGDLPGLFPNLGHFAQQDLGFMVGT